MTTYGLDSDGFTRKPLNAIRTSIEDGMRAELDPGFEIDADNPAGIIAGIIAGTLDQAWQQLLTLYDSLSPINAQGVQLDNLAGVKGLTRLAATPTTAMIQMRGTPGAVVPAGTVVSRGVDGDQYATDADVTLVTDYFAVGDHGGECLATAVEAGYQTAPADTITTIVTPVSGLASVNNDAAATPGRDIESDTELGARMAASGQIIGSGSVNAIRARLLEVGDVQACVVIENTLDTVDGDGRPGHSFEAIIHPNTVDGQSIADMIWLHKPAGIATTGGETETVTDSAGRDHDIKFSFAASVDCDVNVTRTIIASEYPVDGDAQIVAAVEDAFGDLSVGDDVRLHIIIGAIAEIPGIDDLIVTMRRDADPFTATNIVIDDTERAVIDAVVVA